MPKPKDYSEFLKTLDSEAPPSLWSEALQALWWDAKGNWNASHNIAQDIPSETGNWIHAYLHRKEGDEWNARYWYQRAQRSFPGTSLEDELRQIVQYVINN